MLIYLVRHGKAESGGDDAARRLTDAGRKTVKQVARRLREAGVRVDRIEHSGLIRAQETAEILAQAVGGEIAAVENLGPSDAVELTGRRFEAEGESSVMLVGHLPFMERLTSYLLTGDADLLTCHFRTGGVACLSGGQEGWTLEWLLAPDLA
jgi:phosphohistidine phosphatase